jgi:hypothetical protein
VQSIVTIISTVSVIILGALILVIPERMWRVGALAGIFLVQFMVLFNSAQWLISLTLLILGWMSCAVLGTGRQKSTVETNQISRSEMVFRLITYFFSLSAAYLLAQKSVLLFLDLNINSAILGMGIAISGLVVTGFSRPYFNVVFGLIMILTGFEIIYYSLELSLLVVGLFGAIKLGLAFLGSIWFLQYEEEPS